MSKALILFASAVLASSASFAADMSQIVRPLVAATAIQNQCAVIAARIGAMKVPAGLPEARKAEHYNESVKAEQAKAANDPAAQQRLREERERRREERAAQFKSLPPDAQAFLTTIRAERDTLRKCGAEYVKVKKPAEEALQQNHQLIQKIAEKTSLSADDQALRKALVDYSLSQEKLAKGILSLSKDIDHQQYVSRVINKYFLGQED